VSASPARHRVALDVTPLTTGCTGVARYVRELSAALPAAGVDVVPYAIGRGRIPTLPGTAKSRVPLRLAHLAWRFAARPRVDYLVGAVGLVHTCDLLPPPTRRPVVMTVNDLAALEHPDRHARRQVALQRRQLIACGQADLVLTISQATADAVITQGVEAAKVVVTQMGRTPLPSGGRCPVDGPFLLAVGELALRKDLPTLIAAFRRAAIPQNVRLVLAGPDGHGADTIVPLTGGRVVRLGLVSDRTLGALYRGALALCFPSVAEGFGLPVLEAMGSGLPVLCSDLPVLREVTGGSAVRLPSGEVAAWSSALELVVADAALRADLSERGRAAVAAFTWARTAAATRAAYDRLLSCG